MKPLSFLLVIFVSLNVAAQTGADIVAARIGTSSTNIVFKEAHKPSINFFGLIFNSGNSFSADGLQFGLSRSLNEKLYIDVSYASFSGTETTIKVNALSNWYRLRGFEIPLTLNYLFRKPTKRFRVNLGGGFQYQEAHLETYESIDNGSSQSSTIIDDIKTAEFGFVIRPGVQYRVYKTLYLSFIVNASIATNGRYSDSPCFALTYRFMSHKKNEISNN